MKEHAFEQIELSSSFNLTNIDIFFQSVIGKIR